MRIADFNTGHTHREPLWVSRWHPRFAAKGSARCAGHNGLGHLPLWLDNVGEEIVVSIIGGNRHRVGAKVTVHGALLDEVVKIPQ